MITTTLQQLAAMLICFRLLRSFRAGLCAMEESVSPLF